jgi:hypothetical protein
MTALRSTIQFLFILLLPLAPILGQELVIPDFNTNGLYLNAQVAGDTNANGTRKDANRVYVLKRGGVYLSNSYIDNIGYTLRMRAEYGPGAKPTIFLVQNTGTSTYPGRFVWVDNSVNLSNLLVSGVVEGDTAAMSHMPGGLLQTNSAGWDIVVDSCILTNTSGNHIRTDQAARVVKVTNTIFGNMGYLGTSNLGAGKGFDLRGTSCDTLLIQNCSFINSQDRIVRHYTSVANINHFIFDHNTIVNAMAYHGLLSLGWVGAEARITNNLLIDPFAAGNDTDKTRQVEFATSEKDPWNGNRMTWIFTDTSGGHSSSTSYNISNNYYAVSDSGRAFYTRYTGTTGGFPSMFSLPTEGSPLTWFINKKVADSTQTFIKDNNIVLNNVPRLMTALMDWYRSPAGGNKTKNTPTSKWDVTKNDYDRRLYLYYSDTLNCAYSTGRPAYSGGLGGFPAGDLNWFPSRKSAWITWLNNNPTLTLTGLIQGFYTGTTMIPDTVTVELRGAASPHSLVTSAKGVLNSTGNGAFTLSGASNGTPYYLAVKHRNGVETWSGSTVSFSSGALGYNFTTAATQAYGSNMLLKSGKYCFYNGDVSHDGTIDLTDLIAVDNDNSAFVTGYTDTDCNGDGTVDLSDLIIVDNNNSAFISKVVPSGGPVTRKVIRPTVTKNSSN